VAPLPSEAYRRGPLESVFISGILSTMSAVQKSMRSAGLSQRVAARPFVTGPAKRIALRPLRASGAVADIVEKLKTLTLLEASELVKEIETTFGVDASAPAGGFMMAAPGAAAAEVAVVEEQTAFDVVLESFDTGKKIVLLKALRGITQLGLNETKAFVDNLPKTVREGLPKEDAEQLVKDLEAAGAKCKIV
jgi:large subunit ribosomal protein L7/L12